MERTLGTLEQVERKVATKKKTWGVPEPNRLQEWVDSLGMVGSGIVVSTAMGIIIILLLLLLNAVWWRMPVADAHWYGPFAQ